MFEPPRPSESSRNVAVWKKYNDQKHLSTLGGRSVLASIFGAVVSYIAGAASFSIMFFLLFILHVIDDSWADLFIFGVILGAGLGIGLPSVVIYIILLAGLLVYQRRTGRLGGSGVGMPIIYACTATPAIIAAMFLVLAVVDKLFYTR